jgi:hypothetical protein
MYLQVVVQQIEIKTSNLEWVWKGSDTDSWVSQKREWRCKDGATHDDSFLHSDALSR